MKIYTGDVVGIKIIRKDGKVYKLFMIEYLDDTVDGKAVCSAFCNDEFVLGDRIQFGFHQGKVIVLK